MDSKERVKGEGYGREGCEKGERVKRTRGKEQIK